MTQTGSDSSYEQSEMIPIPRGSDSFYDTRLPGLARLDVRRGIRIVMSKVQRTERSYYHGTTDASDVFGGIPSMGYTYPPNTELPLYLFC